jgi:peptide-methionine (S)-S-oxide reductase
MNPTLRAFGRLAAVLVACLGLSAAESVSPASKPMTTPPKLEKATFGAGCFWGVEYQYRKIPGVLEAYCGYSGGKTERPTYREVCQHDTGHAEVIEVTFDPAKVSYRQLVEYFFRMHNPTQVDRQGPDVGDQYRSVIFFHSPEQKKVAEEVKAALTAAKKYDEPIATKVEPAQPFWKAEEYHQRYYEKKGGRPYCHLVEYAPEK